MEFAYELIYVIEIFVYLTFCGQESQYFADFKNVYPFYKRNLLFRAKPRDFFVLQTKQVSRPQILFNSEHAVYYI